MAGQRVIQTILGGLLALSMQLFSPSASAAFELTFSGAPPGSIVDIDGWGLGEIGPSFGPLAFDVVFNPIDPTGGGEPTPPCPNCNEFLVRVVDVSELTIIPNSVTFDPLGKIALSGGSVGLPSFNSVTPWGFEMEFSNVLPLPAFAPLATFAVMPWALGFSPDDEAPDFFLAGIALEIGTGVVRGTVIDPVTGSPCAGGPGCAVGFDAEMLVPAIPIPAALPLFLSAIAGLGFLGWHRRQAT